MKHRLKLIFTLLAIALLGATGAQADDDKKMVIALKTDSFDMHATDIGSLAVGEAKTIETDSGKVIDILRTADGAEIYIDGELLEMDFENEGPHEGHVIRKHVEVICAEGDDCEEHVVVHAGTGGELQQWFSEESGNIIIRKEIELACSDEDGGSSCSDEMVWISDEQDSDGHKLHQVHDEENVHKVIVIKKGTGQEG